MAVPTNSNLYTNFAKQRSTSWKCFSLNSTSLWLRHRNMRSKVASLPRARARAPLQCEANRSFPHPQGLLAHIRLCMSSLCRGHFMTWSARAEDWHECGMQLFAQLRSAGCFSSSTMLLRPSLTMMWYKPQQLQGDHLQPELIHVDDLMFVGDTMPWNDYIQENVGIKLDTAANPIWSWAARHAAWLLNRFKPVRGVTAYELTHGRPYRRLLALFGEPCFAFVKSARKGERKWYKILFIGKTENQDAFICFDGEKILLSKFIRRVGQQWGKRLCLYKDSCCLS